MSVIQDIQSDESRLEMTPMIDVTFLLLIFFLTTIRFKSLEGKLAAYLPKDQGLNSLVTDLPADPMQLTVQVVTPGERVQESDPSRPWHGSADGTFLLEGHQVAFQLDRAHFPGTAEGRAALTEALAAKALASPDRKLKIYTAAGVLHMDAVQVLDMCHAAGLTDVVFAK
jgi:biopolymer transport protein ExbD